MEIFNDTTYVEKTQEEVKQMYYHYKNGDSRDGVGVLYTLTEVNYLLKEVIKGCEESDMVRYALEKLYLNLGDIEIDDIIISRSPSLYILQDYLRMNTHIFIEECTIGYLHHPTKLDAIQVKNSIINSLRYYPKIAQHLINILEGGNILTEEDNAILRRFASDEDIDYVYFYEDLQKNGWGD